MSASPMDTQAQPTVMIGSLDQPFVSTAVEAFRGRHPQVHFIAGGSFRSGLSLRRPAIFHLQMLDVVLRRRSVVQAAAHATKLVTLLAVLRLKRVGIVWTCHNLTAKGHKRRRLDKLLRTTVVLLAQCVVVLNAEARPLVQAELYRPARKRFAQRVVVVPLAATLGRSHGRVIDRSEARRLLQIEETGPLIFHAPGLNRSDEYKNIGRDSIVTIERAEGEGGLKRAANGWVYFGWPDDETYGLLLSACDAVLLTDPNALGSNTAHVAAAFRKPVISPRCPAIAELRQLGAATLIPHPPTDDAISDALVSLNLSEPTTSARFEGAFADFDQHHSDEIVAIALAEAYTVAGFELEEPDKLVSSADLGDN